MHRKINAHVSVISVYDNPVSYRGASLLAEPVGRVDDIDRLVQTLSEPQLGRWPKCCTCGNRLLQ